MTTNVLASKAVLVGVKIRRWTGRRLDRKITDEVNQAHNASDDAGRYNKLLLPKEAFSPINAVRSAARQAHYTLTMPWMDEGARILPAVSFDDFSKRFRQYRADFDKAADEFYREFPKNLKEAEKRLNGMFNPEDYPHQNQVRRMFSFHTYVMPWPTKEDFRVALNKDTLKDFEDQVNTAVQDAMKEPYRRIVETVGRMAERLKAYNPKSKEGVFRDTLVTNVRELAKLLPAFNLADDKNLADMIARIEKELCKHEADGLREDEKLRKTVAKSAEDILKKAEGLMA